MSRGTVRVALETSGHVGSVSVAVGERVEARTFMADRSGHAAGLVPALDAVLSEAGLARRDLDAVVVGGGPGSFTGVRVAAAAGKGLAHALRIPLYAVSSLMGAILTEEALPGGVGPWGLAPERAVSLSRTRYVLFDARGDRVFAAAYRLGDGAPEEVRAPRFAHLPEVLSDEALRGAAFCGDAAVRHLIRIRDAGRVVLPPPVGFPSADGLLRYLALAPDTAPLADPFGWEPDYLRASNAERGGGA